MHSAWPPIQLPFFFLSKQIKKWQHIREKQEFLYPVVQITEEYGPEGFGVSRSEQTSKHKG